MNIMSVNLSSNFVDSSDIPSSGFVDSVAPLTDPQTPKQRRSSRIPKTPNTPNTPSTSRNQESNVTRKSITSILILTDILARSTRRNSLKSYAEPSLNRKLRKGGDYVFAVGQRPKTPGKENIVNRDEYDE